MVAIRASRGKKKIDIVHIASYPLRRCFSAAESCKGVFLKDLRQVTVVGLGLVGGSVALAVRRSLPRVRCIGYSHRESTRDKARQLDIADEVVDTLVDSVNQADLVIMATPVRTFEGIFTAIADSLPSDCIVTDVGSTKVQAHRWAETALGSKVPYVGSHPIAGSEKRGLEYARDDLLTGARCIVTRKTSTDSDAVELVERFWQGLGCNVHVMSPAEHDRILGYVSHVPHLLATALINATDPQQMCFAGKGFIDTSRIASGPANIWTDVLLTNGDNAVRGIQRVVKELLRLQTAIRNQNARQIETLLDKAHHRRAEMIDFKIRNKELL